MIVHYYNFSNSADSSSPNEIWCDCKGIVRSGGGYTEVSINSDNTFGSSSDPPQGSDTDFGF